jgi:nucleotide-binding universal stress UspA family protein
MNSTTTLSSKMGLNPMPMRRENFATLAGLKNVEGDANNLRETIERCKATLNELGVQSFPLDVFETRCVALAATTGSSYANEKIEKAVREAGPRAGTLTLVPVLLGNLKTFHYRENEVKLRELYGVHADGVIRAVVDVQNTMFGRIVKVLDSRAPGAFLRELHNLLGRPEEELRVGNGDYTYAVAAALFTENVFSSLYHQFADGADIKVEAEKLISVADRTKKQIEDSDRSEIEIGYLEVIDILKSLKHCGMPLTSLKRWEC